MPNWRATAASPASELEYHLLLARDLKLIQVGDYTLLADRAIELKRMLTALIQKIADRLPKNFKYFWVDLGKEFENLKWKNPAFEIRDSRLENSL